VGMEIKFEVLRGELASPRRLALPAFAAAGGLIVPGLCYLVLNFHSPGELRGWSAATATDIALALAVLAVVGPRIPSAVRVFLLTVALADNLAAVGLTALMFAGKVHAEALAGAGLSLAVLALLSRWRRAPFLFYAVGFAVVWAFTLDSGVGTSLAGVACAMVVPVGARRVGQESVLKYFMDSIHPYVAYAVLPLFAFTAAGLPISPVASHLVTSPISLGLLLALAVGKPLGVFGFSGLAAFARLARRPTGATWLELFGAALLCGVGVTASLFFGRMSFASGDVDQARLGIFAGSLVAMLAGAAVFIGANARRRDRDETEPR
jgi:Na+:H+ antiporter, NhaA family